MQLYVDGIEVNYTGYQGKVEKDYAPHLHPKQKVKVCAHISFEAFVYLQVQIKMNPS